MKKRLATVMLLAILATPAFGAWEITASFARWQTDVTDAQAAEARDAILWERERQPLIGAIFTAALPGLSVISQGGGVSRLQIEMARTPAETWLAAYAANACPEAATNPEVLACVDEDIKRSLRALVRRYRHHLREQTSPIAEPPDYE